jgi:hypothetical protein
MIQRATIPVVVLLAGLSLSNVHAQSSAQPNPAMSSAQDQQPKTEPKEKADPKGEMASLMGCVDEQAGKWVLVNDQTLALIATLAADGFPTEGFAKFMGHKVTVRGTASSGDSGSTFKVREIKTISETCTAR